jgi:hypothetical protein
VDDDNDDNDNDNNNNNNNNLRPADSEQSSRPRGLPKDIGTC